MDSATEKGSEGVGASNRVNAAQLVNAWFTDPRTAATQQANEDRWLSTLRKQAADPSDPETQANAIALLASR